ncbi:YibE/F family protein [Pseudonocardia ailaonensis]|uniref:YibE/F family protein n=1 Tax=Pseudonocardia ailaonensis TaxID=367279 RepID=UPI0031D51997
MAVGRHAATSADAPAGPAAEQGPRPPVEPGHDLAGAAAGLPVEDGASPRPASATGHGHGHGPATPAGRRARLLLAALLVPAALATLVGLVLFWPHGALPHTSQPVQQLVDAEVIAAQAADCTPGSGDKACAGLTLHMDDGPLPGRDLVQIVPVEPSTPRFAVGDRVRVAWSGADPADPGSYQVVEFQRGTPLVWLGIAFAAAVLVLGRWRGLAALVALGASLVVLVLFVLPAILAGSSPVWVAVVGACLIMFVVLYLTHGPSARTSTAVLGTLVSLLLIALLSTVFGAATRLTGLDDTTSSLIAALGAPVDARGLLLAGMVIGALGVLDDVTVTQTSAVWELRAANPALGARELFAAGMRIGRDHVSSAVNTLVLAYAGAALPLMLLFTVTGQGPADVLTSQDVATEIVRTLVGSIGLVAAVPITTALAAVVASRERP